MKRFFILIILSLILLGCVPTLKVSSIMIQTKTPTNTADSLSVVYGLPQYPLSSWETISYFDEADSTMKHRNLTVKYSDKYPKNQFIFVVESVANRLNFRIEKR